MKPTHTATGEPITSDPFFGATTTSVTTAERIAGFDTDPMDEVDFGNRYVVYVSYVSVAAEEESCRHSVMAPSAYEAALKAVKGCRLLSYEITAVAEVFPHTGTEHRFSYQLTYHA